MNKSIIIPIIIVAVGGPLTGIFLIPMFEDDIPKETVYTLEIDNKTVYEIVINSTDKSKWNVQDSDVMINGTSYSLELFTESVREIEYQYHKTEPKCILSPSLTTSENYVYDCIDYIRVCEKGQPGEKQTYTGCLQFDKPMIKHSDAESRTEGTELGYQKPLPHDHVLIYEKIEQIIEEQKAQRELLEEIYDLGS